MATIEIIILLIIGIAQLWLAVKTISNTNSFKNFFNPKTEVFAVSIPNNLIKSKGIKELLKDATNIQLKPEGELAQEIGKLHFKSKVTYLYTKSKSKVYNNMVSQINSYLVKNLSKTVDFHIIQDIIQRNVESQEEKLERLAPAPLYLGLAATMIGIIIGLSDVEFGESVDINMIEPLINGVKRAMIVSVLGLIITTLLSVYHIRRAKYTIEEKKNNFLSFLQAELMPKMNKAKMPEVKELSDNLKEYSQSNIKTINNLNSLVQQSSDSLQIENQILSNVKALDLKKLSSNTVEIFSQSHQLLDGLSDFNNYYIELNQSLKSTTTLVEKLDSFVKNSDNISVVLTELRISIDQSSKATSFFNKHIESFKLYEDKVNDAVAESDLAFRKALTDLKEITEKEIEGIGNSITNFDKQLSETFIQTTEKYSQVAQKETEKLSATFSESKELMQNLKKLDKLDKLESVLKGSNKEVVKALENLSLQLAKQNPSIPSVSKNTSTGILEKINKILPIVAFGLVSIGAIIYILKTIF